MFKLKFNWSIPKNEHTVFIKKLKNFLQVFFAKKLFFRDPQVKSFRLVPEVYENTKI